MKKSIFIFCMLIASQGFSQKKPYFTSGGEMIFSFATIEDHGRSENSVMRWAPVFNTQSMLNADVSKHFGIFSGLAIRNVGFIYDKFKVPTNTEGGQLIVKKKFRSYNLGFPIGIKIGNLERSFFYGGYEIEFPFHYKEKTFIDGEKQDNITGWFSNRQEKIQHGFLAGIQFPRGFNLKFKYYLSNFLNRDYTESNGNKPYEGLKTNVFYFSLCSNLFKNTRYKAPLKKKESLTAYY